MALSFSPLKQSDFELFAHWLGKPHVNKWWREPATVEHVSKDYGGCTRGDYTTRVYVVQDDKKPIGIIQSFKLEDYPEYDKLFPLPGAVSIDYLIGEEDYIGRGYGTRMIKNFIDTEVRKQYPGASGVAVSAELENLASLGVLKNAGFEPSGVITGEYGTPERVMLMRF
jgi:aminoglycoside 6'-N-acetyltransferase